MRFDLREPCADCPFRTDTPFYLHPGRAKEIAEALVEKGQTFQCHRTIVWVDDEDEEGEVIALSRPENQHCAGAAIMLEHMRCPNQWMQVCERLGWRDPKLLNMSAPVFKNAAEFIAAMDERDRPRPLG